MNGEQIRLSKKSRRS